MDQTNRALVLAVNPQKQLNATKAANLNLSTSHAFNNSLTDMYLRSAKSSISREIADHLATPDFSTRLDVMLNGIDQVTSTGLRNLFVTSSNFALDKFGIAGTIATQLGKDNILLRNKFADRFIKPIADLGSSIVKRDAAMVEHNMAIEFNASLKNYRIFNKETGEFLIKEVSATGESILVPAMKDGKVFRVVDKEVKDLLDLYQTTGREIYDMINVPNKVLGKAPVNDIGFWVPAFNPRDKQIAYVYNKKTDTTSLLYAKTVEELNDGVAKFRARLLAEGDKDTKVFTKGVEQEIYNKLAGRHDPMFMSVADVSMLHGGASAGALTKTNFEPLTEMINGFDHSLGNGITSILELKLQPVMDRLKLISDTSQIGYNKGTLGVVGQGIKKQ